MNQESKTNCKIRREGTVVQLTNEYVLIEFHNKTVKVSREKVHDSVQLGDVVHWNGSQWV